jgi:hypothetical protein
MLRIGVKLEIKEIDDRWGQSYDPKRYYVTDWFWLGLETWQKMDTFQEPYLDILFEEPIKKEELERYLLSQVRDDKPFEGEMSRTLKQLTERIKTFLTWSGGSTVWEFNGLSKNKKGWVRNIILFNDRSEDRKRIWTLKEAYIIRPLLVVKCWFKNFHIIKGAK